MWVRFLAGGDNTLVMLAVNDDYKNTDKGTELTPVKNAAVTVKMPAWMKGAQAFEVTAAGTRPITARTSGGGLQVRLGDFDTTRMIVITTRSDLRSRLQGYYKAKLADNTAVLLKQGSKSR